MRSRVSRILGIVTAGSISRKGWCFFVIMKFIVYIIQSENDGSFYIGFTSDIEQRLSYHNSGKSRYTSRKCPGVCVIPKLIQRVRKL